MIDGEISLKSLLFVTEGLEQMLGKNGANAVLRTAGQRAAVNLIEMLPLTLPEDEAALRTGSILTELGFIDALSMPEPGMLKISGNHIMDRLPELGLQDITSSRYYTIGLFEGFLKKMSGSAKKIVSVEVGADGEIWKLG